MSDDKKNPPIKPTTVNPIPKRYPRKPNDIPPGTPVRILTGDERIIKDDK
jgi:hypothetical protein